MARRHKWRRIFMAFFSLFPTFRFPKGEKMYRVCTIYDNNLILLAEFNTEEEADKFMQHKYIIAYEDETEDGEEVVINPEEMAIFDE